MAIRVADWCVKERNREIVGSVADFVGVFKIEEEARRVFVEFGEREYNEDDDKEMSVDRQIG